jgi:DedD protein
MSLFSFLRKNKQESASSESVGSGDAASERPRRRKSGQGRESVDPMLPEKKRARRRLIGAIALVMAAVVVLPMVLDSEPKPLADDIAIQIPSKDKPQPAKPAPESGKTPDTPKPGSAPATPATPAAPESSTGALPATAGLDAKEELIEPPPLTKSEKPAVPGAVSNAVKPREQTASLSERATEPARPVARSESTRQEAVRSEPKQDIRKSEPPKAELPKKPAQQDKPHAAELAAKDDKAAHKAQQEKLERAERAEKAEKAEKMEEAARARALLEGKTDPRAAIEKSEKDKAAASRYLIQVAALSSQDKVIELQNKLRDAGIKSYAQKVVTESGDRIRIRVGPFASKEEADKMRARIGKLGLGGTVVPS